MRVLLATDGSKYAEHAASLLARLPHSQPLELAILAVTPSVGFHGSLDVVEWMERNQEAEKRKVAEACRRIEGLFEGADVRLQTIFVNGHPGSTIVAQAEELKSELVVLGAVGSSMLERMMLGSTSDFVATHAPCSVLVVRPDQGESPTHRNLKLCIADDQSPAAEFAIEQLSEFGWGAQTHIDLVNVLLSPLSFSELPVTYDSEELRTDMLEKLNARLDSVQSLSPHVDMHVIEDSHIGEGLVDFAQRRGSDLLVLGNTGRGLLSRFLMGSTSRFAIRHARCSVWIARRQAT
ncbi:MAG: universal stress protein [Pirellulaceae bacterium]